MSEEAEAELKEAAVISMGTDVSDLDLANIRALCDQVLALSEYRAQLYDYLRSRMNTIAPNLTALVGELVGARLIAHGGSLLNLAKQPGSTIQILGAEKVFLLTLLNQFNNLVNRMDLCHIQKCNSDSFIFEELNPVSDMMIYHSLKNWVTSTKNDLTEQSGLLKAQVTCT